MENESISDPDVELARLLIVRQLRDLELAVDAHAIEATIVDKGYWGPNLRIRHMVNGIPFVSDSSWKRPDRISLATLKNSAEMQVGMFRYAVNLDAASLHNLRELIVDLTKTAKREVAKANRAAIPLKLIDIHVSPGLNTQGYQIRVDVEIEKLGADLLPDRAPLDAWHPDRLAYLITRLADDQKERARRKALFDGMGAVCAIESVALSAMRRDGVDVPSTIRRMLDPSQRGYVMIKCCGVDLQLSWRHGLIYGSAQISDGFSYSDGDLRISKDVRLGRRRILAGLPATDIVKAQFLKDVVVEAYDTSMASQTTRVVTLERTYLPVDRETFDVGDEPVKI